jgi:hypothetical protein
MALGDEDAGSTPHACGPVWRRTYKPNAGKHGPVERGDIGREPRDGQEALDTSTPVKPTSAVRISIDYDERAFIVLRHTFSAPEPRPNDETYHGYVTPWKMLTDEMKNALIRARMANRRGKDPVTHEKLMDQGLGPITAEAADRALASGDPGEISMALLRLALHGPDWERAERLARKHTGHPAVWVRRNAATALGHVARVHGRLDLDLSLPELNRLLDDPEVRDWADAALDDVETYLGVKRTAALATFPPV